ncbi:heterokaryon incompatibility protein-domain-containing protein [Xylaria acuta]|nr:heterokaryon incompatibility protein-domain-containing protein [Xylaria acuta]
MRLLDVYSLEIREFHGKDIPPYVILSHTWGPDEVTFQDFQDLQHLTYETTCKQGFSKIERCCELARQNGFGYAWVDTCCIDKKNHVELSEAINSMFMWYANAEICFALLEDVSIGDPSSSAIIEEELEGFSSSRWFTRGWTLQELIAPSCVVFYDQNGEMIGTRSSLQKEISTITKIPKELLGDLSTLDLSTYSVAQRMSWAADRNTTRVEDEAYCLLGIFDVNIPLIYGEGRHAFLRLQEEILRRKEDYSILAWGGVVSDCLDPEGSVVDSGRCDVLAISPSMFKNSDAQKFHSPDYLQWPRYGQSKNAPHTIPPMAMTSRGLLVCMQLHYLPNVILRGRGRKVSLAVLGYEIFDRVACILLIESNLDGEFERLKAPGNFDGGYMSLRKRDVGDPSELLHTSFHIARRLSVRDRPFQLVPWSNLSVDVTRLKFCFVPGRPVAIDIPQSSALTNAQKLSTQIPQQFIMRRLTNPFFLRVSAFRYFIIPCMTEDCELFAIVLHENGSIIIRYESSSLQVDSPELWVESLKDTARAMAERCTTDKRQVSSLLAGYSVLHRFNSFALSVIYWRDPKWPGWRVEVQSWLTTEKENGPTNLTGVHPSPRPLSNTATTQHKRTKSWS